MARGRWGTSVLVRYDMMSTMVGNMNMINRFSTTRPPTSLSKARVAVTEVVVSFIYATSFLLVFDLETKDGDSLTSWQP